MLPRYGARQADALLHAFAAALAQDDDAEPALQAHGPLVAARMVDWKLGHGDGRLERWTLGDLRELLLDRLPRSSPGEEAIAIAADAVSAFLAFLDQESLLDAPVPLASLESAVVRLRPRFEQACGRLTRAAGPGTGSVPPAARTGSPPAAR